MAQLDRITRDATVMGGKTLHPRHACYGRHDRGTDRCWPYHRGVVGGLSLFGA